MPELTNREIYELFEQVKAGGVGALREMCDLCVAEIKHARAEKAWEMRYTLRPGMSVETIGLRSGHNGHVGTVVDIKVKRARVRMTSGIVYLIPLNCLKPHGG